jgi:hypothetical protein
MSTISTLTTGRQAAFPDGEVVPSLSEPRFAGAGFSDADLEPTDTGSSSPQVIELEPGELSTSEEMALDEAVMNAEAAVLKSLAKTGGCTIRMERQKRSWESKPVTSWHICVIPGDGAGVFAVEKPTLNEAVEEALRKRLAQKMDAFGAALESAAETDSGVTL